MYGDDAQMASNYPVVKITDMTGRNVWYAKTVNWPAGAVATGSEQVSADFTLPAGVPTGQLLVSVTANGIMSDPIAYTFP